MFFSHWKVVALLFGTLVLLFSSCLHPYLLLSTHCVATFIPVYLHGSIQRLAWKSWWKWSPILTTTTRVQIVMNCVLTCFSLVFRTIHYITKSNCPSCNELCSNTFFISFSNCSLYYKTKLYYSFGSPIFFFFFFFACYDFFYSCIFHCFFT